MHLLSVIAALCALSSKTEAGGRALAKDIQGIEIVCGKKQDGGWVHSSVPVGAKVTLKGSARYNLIACLFTTSFGPNAYLPALSKAVKPSEVTGVVSIGLPPEAMSYWS
ncbi:hypothetical protein BDP27DRAFT_1492532 [Rhodocollybia butyracea]|uniref:Uncharacterized protein n=1 Tax=Rhodocollybia butyracea TaxID=206335 RepID=A0A9P5PCA8_9AGAR|nr:hypothetical protein BDP27DRAFT_1492532 [Rhodocollybia butyracea]